MKTKSKSSIIGLTLALLILLSLINSAYFFLCIARFGLFEWLAFNACSLSMITYLICYTCAHFTKKEYYLAIALVPLYYYGTMGLFLIQWNISNLFPHITHVIITLNVIWILYLLLKKPNFDSLGKGLLIGVFLFFPLFAVVHHYVQSHSTELLQLLQKVQQ